MRGDREPYSPEPGPLLRADRPLSPFGAVGWACLAVIAMDAITRVSLALRPALEHDIINGGACAALALSLITYGVVRLHLPMRAVSDALGARRTAWVVYPLALVMGAAMLFADAWLEGIIDRRWPPSQEMLEMVSQVRIPAAAAYRVLLCVVVAGLSPATEEMLFRGAIFRAVRLGRQARVAVMVTAFAFALVHLNVLAVRPAAFGYLFASGLVLALARALSGSLWASLLAHMTFNGLSAWSMLREREGEVDPPTSLTVGLAGVIVTGACLAAIAWAGRSSERGRAARATDAR